MTLWTILILAYKNLLHSKMRTFLTVGGVILGIGAIVFLLSLGYGLQELTVKQVVTLNVLYTIDVNPGSSSVVKLDQTSLSNISNLPNITEVVPQVNVAGKVRYNSSMTDVVVYGGSKRFWELADTPIKLGDYWSAEGSDQALISNATLKVIGLEEAKDAIGKDLIVDLSINKNIKSSLTVPETVSNIKLNIVGVVDDDTGPAIYTSYDKIRSITGFDINTQAKVYVADRAKISDARILIDNTGLKTAYVGDTVSQIESVFSVFRIVLGAFGVIAMVVAALGMFNTLTVSLLERNREIAIMIAFGAKRKDIHRMFMAEAIFISTTGGVGGIVGGVLLGQGVNLILSLLSKQSGGTGLSVFITPSSFILFTIGFVFIVGFVTGFYPASRAAKTKVLDALRHE